MKARKRALDMERMTAETLRKCWQRKRWERLGTLETLYSHTSITNMTTWQTLTGLSLQPLIFEVSAATTGERLVAIQQMFERAAKPSQYQGIRTEPT
jgi:hypothetical protein